MSYFPCDIPFMSDEELKENGINIPKDVSDTNVGNIEYIRKQITKGDVIRIKSTPEIEILVTYADEEYVSGIALTEVDDNCEIGDQYTNIRICNVEKTGEHYEIAEVLAKMKETNNG